MSLVLMSYKCYHYNLKLVYIATAGIIAKRVSEKQSYSTLNNTTQELEKTTL